MQIERESCMNIGQAIRGYNTKFREFRETICKIWICKFMN